MYRNRQLRRRLHRVARLTTTTQAERPLSATLLEAKARGGGRGEARTECVRATASLRVALPNAAEDGLRRRRTTPDLYSPSRASDGSIELGPQPTLLSTASTAAQPGCKAAQPGDTGSFAATNRAPLAPAAHQIAGIGLQGTHPLQGTQPPPCDRHPGPRTRGRGLRKSYCLGAPVTIACCRQARWRFPPRPTRTCTTSAAQAVQLQNPSRAPPRGQTPCSTALEMTGSRATEQRAPAPLTAD